MPISLKDFAGALRRKGGTVKATAVASMLEEIDAQHDVVEKERDEARALNADLREALQALVDVQNGPPLHEYAEAWNAAMRKAHDALRKAGAE